MNVSIKKDIEYDYAFGLGVSPDDLWFGIWSKSEVQQLTTSMTKDGSDSFKLTASKWSHSPCLKTHVKASFCFECFYDCYT